MFGTQELPSGFHLSSIGPPGCHAWIVPVASIGGTFEPVGDGIVGMEVVTLLIPNVQGLVEHSHAPVLRFVYQ